MCNAILVLIFSQKFLIEMQTGCDDVKELYYTRIVQHGRKTIHSSQAFFMN